MRFLGIDVGARRVGLAVTDASAQLARPLTTLAVAGVDDAIDRVMAAIERLQADEDGLQGIVVGMPVRLDGSANAATAHAAAFIEGLKAGTSLPIATEDERLTSHEADARLAVNERDWRKRKTQLDAAAAAII